MGCLNVDGHGSSRQGTDEQEHNLCTLGLQIIQGTEGAIYGPKI